MAKLKKRTVCLIMAISALYVSAETRRWLGSVGGLWTSTVNWEDGLLPGAGDVADLSAATGTIDLPTDIEISGIYYNPVFSGTLNVLTILSDTASTSSSRAITLSTTRRIEVGEGAQLLMDADLKPNGETIKVGQGSLVIKRRLAPTAKISLYVEQGRLINEGSIVFPGMSLRVGTVEPDSGAPAEWVMREGSSFYSTSSGGWDVWWGANRLGSNDSRALITHEGGSLDILTNSVDGSFLHGFSPSGSSVYNLSGGEMDGRTKAVYVGYKGSGTINQSGGRFLASRLMFSRLSVPSGGGTYNLTGGELWLGGVSQKGAGTASFNLGGGCLYPLSKGFKIYDNTSPRLTGVNGLTRFCSTGSGFTNVVSGLSGPGGFVKEGADTLNIDGGVHSFTGPVIVSNGTVNVKQTMSGGNAVLITGGVMNLGNVAVNYSSLKITGGVFGITAGSKLSILGNDPAVQVTGSGVFKMLSGSELPGLTTLDLSGDATIDLSNGGTATVYRLVVDGIERSAGFYTVENCDFITGLGTLTVNGGLWSGGGADGLWSTGENWLAGVVPDGVRSVVELSRAVSMEESVASITLDMESVTCCSLVLNSGINGSVITNNCPAGVTNTLNMAAEGTVYVGEGETLVLDCDICLLGTVYKRGEGSLILLRRSTDSKAGGFYLRVEEGRVVNCGPMINMRVMVGKPDRSMSGPTPEYVLEDTPEASFTGNSFIAVLCAQATSLYPGNGLFTQNGGLVTPDVNWGTRSVIGFINHSGVSIGGTGTYHLANGTLRVQNDLELSRKAGFGVLNQTGGLADLDSFMIRRGDVFLTGGLLQLNSFNNANPSLCTFYFGGGRMEPKTATALNILSSAVFTGTGGEMTFAPAAGRSINLAESITGPAGFVKEGAGAVNFSGRGSFSGLADIREGIVSVSGVWLGTNDVLLSGGMLNITGIGGFRLGDLAVTNGMLVLDFGTVVAAQRFFVAGEEFERGVYTASDVDALTGEGLLIVGAVPGEWTGNGRDDSWSTADNWVAGIIPQSLYLTVDLSAAVSNETPTRTLLLNIAAVTNKQVIFDSGVAGAVLTNTSPGSVTNTICLASEGVIEVGLGETLVLDCDLCLLGSIYKRGQGDLILRRRSYTLPALVTSVSASYIIVEGGRVINEGPIANVMISVGKLSRYDEIETPEFIMGDTPNSSISGTSFITVLNRLATKPGPGLFTQNGGVVAPGVNWINRLSMAYTSTELPVEDYGIGTYNLVSGTLVISNGMYFGRSGTSDHGNYGVFNQSGGIADIEVLYGMYGEMHLTGGLLRLGKNNSVGPNITMYLGGGCFEPKTTEWVKFSSPIVFTGVNGDMIFDPAADQTIQLSVDAPSRGAGGFVKAGDGLLELANTNTFIGTAAIQAGTCSIAGAGGLAQCTNLVVGAAAHLTLQRDGAALNTNLWLKVNADGQVNLDYAGEVEVGHLVINGREWPGRGTRYGSSSSAGEVDKVFDTTFTGTGVLKVVGPRRPQGTLLQLR